MNALQEWQPGCVTVQGRIPITAISTGNEIVCTPHHSNRGLNNLEQVFLEQKRAHVFNTLMCESRVLGMTFWTCGRYWTYSPDMTWQKWCTPATTVKSESLFPQCWDTILWGNFFWCLHASVTVYHKVCKFIQSTEVLPVVFYVLRHEVIGNSRYPPLLSTLLIQILVT